MKMKMSKKGDKGKSAPQYTATGSGSRPMGGKYKIPTSAPSNEHTLERAPSKWLK